MSRDHLAEVQRVLLLVSEAGDRAERMATALSREGADQHLVEALEEADRELLAIRRRLVARAHFATPLSTEAQQRL